MPSFKNIERSGERLLHLLETAKASPMTDMIERMARAMIEAQGVEVLGGDLRLSSFGNELADQYTMLARAALSALEEPSEEMVNAGFNAAWNKRPKDIVPSVWSAMISAAKGSET